MIIVNPPTNFGGLFHVSAHIQCDGCGTTSEPQGACGVHAKVDAQQNVKAHVATRGWGHTYEPGKLGRERVSFQRDKCPTCLARVSPAKAVAS